MNTSLSDSPDLGPPPIAHFEVPDPVKFDRSPPPVHVENDEDSDSMAMVDLSSNLARRRKRRASSLLEDMAFEERVKEDEKGSSTKETNGDSEGTSADDHPKPRRKPSVKSVCSAGDQENWIIQSKTKSRDKGIQISSSGDEAPLRRALGSKSTNSPSKQRTINVADRISALKDEVTKTAQARERKRERRVSSTMTAKTTNGRYIEEQQGIVSEPANSISSSHPKTPGPSMLDLLSPTSSDAPSTGKAVSQPSEMASTTASLEDIVSNASGRGSRRARPQVSYAEPNLRDKMRRPGKELVDAVAVGRPKTETGQQRSSIEPEDQPTVRKVMVKKEQLDHPLDGWKNLPTNGSELTEQCQQHQESASPLSGKTSRQQQQKQRMF
ncbi:putative shugoshin c terminal domain-containing protein [Phaeomoniella chlamydospora]|uniref:Putative shugoshin c terminal domain-containing protein n=1 Tax=Phaeomoniella chlamydospora TaxID=158046 RepID=A0A0G2ENI1_PHACM|nr:putative shugoshin c terminal domain-containing protein [Phaeomoniella chlamydospora]